MVERIELNFATQSKEYIAKQLNAQVCKNWYWVPDKDGKFKMPMFPFPGSQLWSDDSGVNKSVRGMYSLNGNFYAVVDYDFRVYNDNGDWNVLGTLATGEGIVKFMANDNQIFITDFSHGYVYQLVETASRKAGTFFEITNASSYIATPTFVGTGLNDMTTLGSYSGTNDKKYKITIDGQSQSSISDPSFSGSGKNDMLTGGTYSGGVIKYFKVVVDSTPATPPDTFKWSDDNGSTWKATAVAMSGTAITLEDGVTISFKSTTGHKVNDFWVFTATPAGTTDTFKWSEDNGATWAGEHITISAADQLLSDGVEIHFGHQAGHHIGDYWVFVVTIDSAFFAPVSPIYLDSYGLFIKSNTQRFYLSSSEDFSQIEALDYASANAFPDSIVCGAAANEEIVFIGEYTTEFWYDTGATTFPIQRRPNLLINWGTSAPYSLAVFSGNEFVWLAQNQNGGRVVVMMQNYQIQIISDKSINDKLQSYSYVDDAIGLPIEWSGRKFYFLTIPEGDITLVFDLDAKTCHQRTTFRAASSLMKQDNIEGRYLANCHVYHNDEHYIGDWQSGKIYKLSERHFKDGTLPIINEAVSAPLNKTLNRISGGCVDLGFESAVANTTGEGSEPLVTLQFSADGGFTWSKEMPRNIGKTGEYKNHARWAKPGAYGRGIVYKVRSSDPVYKVFMGGIVEVEDTGT